MSSSATDPTTATGATEVAAGTDAPVSPAVDKGKGKAPAKEDDAMEQDEEDDEDDEDEDDAEEEEEEDEEDDDMAEIDPAAILPTSRRTRGARVDYTSAEALSKAGLTGKDEDDDEDDKMKD
ncbi:histone H2A.Z-specific chaperone CHZ1 [Armillaria novae-zelandiae]|uniref:Histone H2A.Z-specific chaperone CHZ1 n=1 Tax=Armillaria novae-zelandiae TaxID=153914 RepID=A0AA39U3K7_9AGAR|nr:histone H2A.Z-specific chaperone CHZ1 [Armillaria novae-zelandiae]